MTAEFELLFDREPDAGEAGVAPGYGGVPFRPDGSPRLLANFVASVDGIITFDDRPGGPTAVGLNSDADRLVMSMLRAAVDSVLVGAGTMRADPKALWTHDFLAPGRAADLQRLRRELTGSSEPPALIVISGHGSVDAGHPALATPAQRTLVITSEPGARALPPLAHAEVLVLGDTPRLDPASVIAAVQSETGPTVLSEAGPDFFGQLVRDGLVDDLFLTLSPQLVGRSDDQDRPGIVAGVAFNRGEGRRLELRSARRAGSHLFLHYRAGGSHPASP